MKSLLVVAILCSLLLAFSEGAKRSSRASVTVTWSGGIPRCANCGSNGAYACSTGVGQWNHGIQTFTDPLRPAPGVEIVEVSATVYGAWSCNASYAALLQLAIAGNIIDVQQASSTQMCQCNTCDPPITFYSNLFEGGLPGYNLQGENSVSLLVLNNNAVCVNRVVITFTYTEPEVSTEVVVLPYSAPDSTSTCSICNFPKSYSCSSGYYWNSGYAYFTDPLPKGSVLLSAAIKVFGTFYENTTVSGRLGNLLIGSIQTTNSSYSGSIPCNTCQPETIVSSAFYQTGWPSYKYGTSNTFQLVLPTASYTGGCVSFVQLLLDYYQPNN